jgi:hypothetical protein
MAESSFLIPVAIYPFESISFASLGEDRVGRCSIAEYWHSLHAGSTGNHDRPLVIALLIVLVVLVFALTFALVFGMEQTVTR